MSDTDNIRQEFEQYICDNIESEAGFEFALQKDIDGNYYTAWVSHRWSGWQAATERATASQWQDIATAPMHQIVLVSVVGAGVTFGSRIGSCGWTWEELDDEPADGIVSHWMPLPPPAAIRQATTIGETL